jgi:hypothetical protein
MSTAKIGRFECLSAKLILVLIPAIHHTKCPIHPLPNHTWDECYLNAANKNKPKPNCDKAKKRPEKTKKDEVDGHTTHLANDDVSIMTLTTAHGTLDSLSTLSEPRLQ